MKFEFEISISGEDWQAIPEEIFYDSLYTHVNKITPLIRDMLNSKVVQYGYKRYRICFEKGED